MYRHAMPWVGCVSWAAGNPFASGVDGMLLTSLGRTLHLQVFTLEELQFIADLCIKHNTYALCDEVYEHLVFEPYRHISLRTMPGMAERSIRLGSAGKTFSFTAWKVGGFPLNSNGNRHRVEVHVTFNEVQMADHTWNVQQQQGIYPPLTAQLGAMHRVV